LVRGQTCVAESDNGNGEIVAVDYGDIIEGLAIASIEGEFGECYWRLTLCALVLCLVNAESCVPHSCLTIDRSSTVSSSTSRSTSLRGAFGVETAVRSSPHTTLPIARYGLILARARREFKPLRLRPCTALGHDSGIYGFSALVRNDQRHACLAVLSNGDLLFHVVDGSGRRRKERKERKGQSESQQLHDALVEKAVVYQKL